MTAHQVGKAAIDDSSFFSPSGRLLSVEQLAPERISIRSDRTTSRFACQLHDNDVFKGLDDPKTINVQHNEHQFKLGLRSLLGTTSAILGTLDYCRTLMDGTNASDSGKDLSSLYTSFLPIPYDIQRNQRSYLEHGISNLKRTADKLQTEIKHWQDIYVRQGERPIISYHAATRTHIRVAVSAVIDVNNVVTTVVILPRQKEGTETSPCEIILTCRAPEGVTRIRTPILRAKMKQELSRIKNLLSSTPVLGLPSLVKRLSMNHASYFFFSLDDYYQVIPESDRSIIENEIVSDFNNELAVAT